MNYGVLTHDFKVGDKIEVIRNTSNFSIGAIFTIKRIKPTGFICVDDSGIGYANEIFKLIEREKPSTELEWIKWFSGDRE